jgi:hypothetical protein
VPPNRSKPVGRHQLASPSWCDRLELCGKSGRPASRRIKGWPTKAASPDLSSMRRSSSAVDLFSIRPPRREMGSLGDCLLLPNKAAARRLSTLILTPRGRNSGLLVYAPVHSTRQSRDSFYSRWEADLSSVSMANETVWLFLPAICVSLKSFSLSLSLSLSLKAIDRVQKYSNNESWAYLGFFMFYVLWTEKDVAA